MLPVTVTRRVGLNVRARARAAMQVHNGEAAPSMHQNGLTQVATGKV